ncbi:phospholysine phosphohistidine inorganic pyrophosphate phosphatase-like isoform X2 [Littorina saxatilis]|uniref:Phospholysine phosphohistidine inorganic pyrophosphate phosphatase n=1 Tax=Littorina saxatilis TaxID=31220 RepID=A0AAN9GIY8_9CAEN
MVSLELPSAVMAFNQKPVRAVLLDISGVLKNCVDGKDVAIKGSVDAVNRLKASGMPVRFCTNETTTTRSALVKKLQAIGFKVEEDEVFPPAPATCLILKQRGLRPHLLIHPALEPDFKGMEQKDPNCVVIGDAQESFSYQNMNAAFQTLIALDKPVLISMGQGKYYSEDNKLVLDVGAYKAALEYACGIQAEVVGKPSQAFFLSVLSSMNAKPEETVMVGDDIESDVGGAQKCGMRGVLVRTGKYRPSDEQHPKVKPDSIVDNLAQAVDILLKTK